MITAQAKQKRPEVVIDLDPAQPSQGDKPHKSQNQGRYAQRVPSKMTSERPQALRPLSDSCTSHLLMHLLETIDESTQAPCFPSLY